MKMFQSLFLLIQYNNYDTPFKNSEKNIKKLLEEPSNNARSTKNSEKPFKSCQKNLQKM